MKYLALLIFLSACAQGVLRQDIDRELDMIVDWIAANSDLVRPTRARPHVVVTSNDELQRMAKSKMGQIGALYDPVRNVIVFNEEWQAYKLRDRSFALHEVVHWMELNQPKTKFFLCNNQREILAYKLQSMYLTSQGSSLLRETGLTHIMVKELTLC